MSAAAAIPLIAGSSILGAGASIYAGNKAANATIAAGQQQSQFANTAYGQNQDILAGLSDQLAGASSDISSYLDSAKGSISGAYANAKNIIANIPSVSAEYPTAEALSLQDFNFRDAIQKNNLKFALGRSGQDLRGAQDMNSALANLDSSSFNGKVNDILNSSFSDLKAMTVGEPTGSFANLSTKNLYNFSNQALSNSLQLDDFFKKNGTVDPISPLQTSFQLQQVDQSIAGLGIQNEQWQGQNLANVNLAGVGATQGLFQDASQIAGMGISSNNTLAQLLSSAAGSTALGQAQAAQSIVPAIGMLSQGITASAGLGLTAQSLSQQGLYQNAMINYLNGKSNLGGLSTFAPTTTVGSGLPISSASSALTGSYAGGSTIPGSVSNYVFNNGGYYPSSGAGSGITSYLPGF